MPPIVLILVALALCAGAFFLGSAMGSRSAQASLATVFDSVTDVRHYYAVLHEFMSREFSIEIHRQFTHSTTERVAQGSEITAFVRKLGDPETFETILRSISVTIIMKMGRDLRNAFFRGYDREETFLSSYVATYVYYRLRQIVTSVSEVTVANSMHEDPRDALSTDDLTKAIFMVFEREVYQNFDFDTKMAENTREGVADRQLRPEERRI